MAIKQWTDEMIHELASSVADLRESVADLRYDVDATRESVAQLRDGFNTMQDGLDTLRDSVDGLRITAQALLQIAAQSQRDTELLKQKQAETDARFNILLEELRYLNRRDDRGETEPS